MKSGEYKCVFESGDELVPNPEGGWKLVYNENEIDLPVGSRWKIVFTDGTKLFSLPYKKVAVGEWARIDGTGFLKGDLVVYMGGGLSKPIGMLNVEKALLKRQFNTTVQKRDDYDDEDNVMRALSSGNGDRLGF
ncbi:hypothetical protein AUC43_15255 [Hymenobacter sedentarius]|uniref:Uncharacterized protein n=2 Tax=Hymenobacter sedentarius TaxID=1411621 RepID=A0A0U4AS99_9BACT|nr:hypothetical protein AUC43_15255 [Hymenobacter sedentarius]